MKRDAVCATPGRRQMKTASADGSPSEEPPGSLPNDLHEDPLPAHAVKFPVEDLFPRAKVEPPSGHRDDDLAAHDRALEVGVRVVLAAVVRVLAVRLLGS